MSSRVSSVISSSNSFDQTQRNNQSNSRGRVKVGIRVRPPFREEIELAEGNYFSIVNCLKSNQSDDKPLASVAFTLLSGKQLEYTFDFAFSEQSTQDEVYDEIAKPVVNDVLRGLNGTIFAYGQTGTGKTYTMGILERVTNENSGIIPRTISQIFSHSKTSSGEVRVSLSFLQLYRETLQDLLASPAGQLEDSLNIREDPIKGFFVEGLQEFIVKSYSEAEALINFGLENRAMAPTLMNATSSRSHTVLTIHITQSGDVSLSGGGSLQQYSRTIRRGTASTALIATVGPAPVNYSETSSTLAFASRCMAVRSSPVVHEDVDYAELCGRLQEKLGNIEEQMSEKLLQQQKKYETIIDDLNKQINELREESSHSQSTIQSKSSFDISIVQSFLEILVTSNSSTTTDRWVDSFLSSQDSNNVDILLGLVGYLYELLSSLNRDVVEMIRNNANRETAFDNELTNRIEQQQEIDLIRKFEHDAMLSNDLFTSNLISAGLTLGSHLRTISTAEASIGTDQNHKSNNKAISNSDRYLDSLTNITEFNTNTQITNFRSSDELVTELADIQTRLVTNLNILDSLLNRKDKHYHKIKDELIEELIERRKREEEVVNWSYILKYLLSSSSKLKKQLKQLNQSNNNDSISLLSKRTDSDRKADKLLETLIDRNADSNINSQITIENSKSNPIATIANDEVDIVSSSSTNRKVDVVSTSSTNKLEDKQSARSNTFNIESRNIASSRTIDEENESLVGSVLSFQSAATVRSIPMRVHQPPTLLAQGLVQDLGLEGEEAVKAMRVIDQIASFSQEQLDTLDKQTRQQILSMRESLGINKYLANQNNRSRDKSVDRRLYRSRNPSSERRNDSPLDRRMKSNSPLRSITPSNSQLSTRNESSRQRLVNESLLSDNVDYTTDPNRQNETRPKRRPFESSERSQELDKARVMAEAYRIHRNGLTRGRSMSISSNRTSVLDIDLSSNHDDNSINGSRY
eukprot:gene17371-22919_t